MLVSVTQPERSSASWRRSVPPRSRPSRPAAGEVAQFHVCCWQRRCCPGHRPGWAVAQVGRHVAVDDASGYAGFNAVTDLQHHAAGRRQHLGLFGGFDNQVAGLVRMTSRCGTYFSSSFWVSRSKSKFCSSTDRLPGALTLRSRAVSGCMRALTSRNARLVAPGLSCRRRWSLTRPGSRCRW